jgi:hypothetical protein
VELQPAGVTSESTDESRSGNAFLSLSKPPKIVQACREWQKLMQVHKDKCVGRALALITGLETGTCILDSLVQCTQARGWLSLYQPTTGRKILCGLQAKLVEQTGARTTYAPRVCKLTMSPCTHALDCKTLVSDEQSSMLIVKAASPHYIVYASKSFCIAYGFGNGSIVGHTAQVLLGPTSDVTRWNETIEQVPTDKSIPDRIPTVLHGSCLWEFLDLTKGQNESCFVCSEKFLSTECIRRG